MMKCPACPGELELNRTDETGFWRCKVCGGLWMPFGALEELIEHERGWWDEDFSRDKRAKETIAEGGRICPEDGTTLRAIPCPEAHKVRIDECPTCHGEWLDIGELQMIQEDAHGIFKAFRSEMHEDTTAWRVFLGKILPFLPK